MSSVPEEIIGTLFSLSAVRVLLLYAWKGGVKVTGLTPVRVSIISNPSAIRNDASETERFPNSFSEWPLPCNANSIFGSFLMLLRYSPRITSELISLPYGIGIRAITCGTFRFLNVSVILNIVLKDQKGAMSSSLNTMNFLFSAGRSDTSFPLV